MCGLNNVDFQLQAIGCFVGQNANLVSKYRYAFKRETNQDLLNLKSYLHFFDFTCILMLFSIYKNSKVPNTTSHIPELSLVNLESLCLFLFLKGRH